MKKPACLFVLFVFACSVLLVVSCAEERSDDPESDADADRLIVTIDRPGNGSRVTIGDGMPIGISASGDYDVALIQWHIVALLNIHPMQLQYGRQRFSPPLHEVRLEDSFSVPFNRNFRYLDLYAMAEDVQGNRSSAVVRIYVADY